MFSTIRYGITGCGFVGAEMARIITHMPNAQLTAVQSGTGEGARRVAQEADCDVSATFDELMTRQDIDAILVSTPNYLHREPVVKTAQNRKHVFCEKPLALSVEDCDAMIAACGQAGVHLMVGHMMHFYSGLIKAKEWIQSDVIGKPLVAHVERTGWEAPRENVSWKKQQSLSGGHLFHHIHEIDLLQWFIGPITEVYAVAGNLAHQEAGFGDEDDVLLLTLKFENGAFGSMQYGSGFRWGEHSVKINGTEGAIFINNNTSTLYVMHPGKEIERYPLFDEPEAQQSMLDLFQACDGGSTYGAPTDRMRKYLRDAMQAELAYFNDVLLGKPVDEDKAMLFGGRAARSAVSVASAALTSKRAGRRVIL